MPPPTPRAFLLSAMTSDARLIFALTLSVVTAWSPPAGAAETLRATSRSTTDERSRKSMMASQAAALRRWMLGSQLGSHADE